MAKASEYVCGNIFQRHQWKENGDSVRESEEEMEVNDMSWMKFDAQV